MLLVCSLEVVVKAPITPFCSMTNWNHPLMLCLHQKLHQPISARALVFHTDCHRSSGLTFRGALSLPNGGFKDRVLSLAITYTQYSS